MVWLNVGFVNLKRLLSLVLKYDSNRSEDWILYAHNQTQSWDAHSRTKHGTLDKWNVKSGHKD